MDRKAQPHYGFNWGKYLADKKATAAPVHLFNHAQMSSNWIEIESGVKVEVLNTDCPVSSKVYWIAEIIKVAGYKALLRYEGYGDDSQFDFWCNLCTHDVHAVGWCATVGKPLVPPRDIQFKYSNWKNFLIQRLTGSKTLPNDFNERVSQSMECPFKGGIRLEVMDKTQISRKRIGIVHDVVGGRLRLQYEDSDEAFDDFWCHCHSFLIHPVGWSERIGHRILVANKDYKNIQGYQNAPADVFTQVKAVKNCGFKAGMKLEAIDPLNLSSICVATVQKVLKDGYVMIGIDGSMATGGSDWFCFHCSSPSIFPMGYCESNNITLSTPSSYKPPFRWSDYLKETESIPAPSNCFLKENIDHDFVAGMKLEAVDLMEPRLLCVATVSRVVGRLLQIHFDGWEAEYDQWIDCCSPDIFPVGWCELVNYSLQAPANYKAPFSNESERNKRKSKSRSQSFSGKKKRKKLSSSDKKESFDAGNPNEQIKVDDCSDTESKNVIETNTNSLSGDTIDPDLDVDIQNDSLQNPPSPDDSEEDYLGPPAVSDEILDGLEPCDDSEVILPSENSSQAGDSNSAAAAPLSGFLDKTQTEKVDSPKEAESYCENSNGLDITENVASEMTSFVSEDQTVFPNTPEEKHDSVSETVQPISDENTEATDLKIAPITLATTRVDTELSPEVGAPVLPDNRD